MLGKVLGLMVGGTLGMLLGWPGGLVAIMAGVGALLGHFAFDRDVAPQPRAFRPPSRDELLSDEPAPRKPRVVKRPEPRRLKRNSEDSALVQALCPLFVEVARADSPPVQPEIRVIREFFEQRLQFDAALMDEVRDSLKAAIAAEPGDIEALTTKARALVKPSLRVEVVRSLYDVGMVDGDLARSEQEVLKRIVNTFNLSDEQLREVTSEFFGKGDANYAVLGLTPEASDEELKSAYRRLAAEHHPDHAKDGGEQFRLVKDAYEALRKLRGT